MPETSTVEQGKEEVIDLNVEPTTPEEVIEHLKQIYILPALRHHQDLFHVLYERLLALQQIQLDDPRAIEASARRGDRLAMAIQYCEILIEQCPDSERNAVVVYDLGEVSSYSLECIDAMLKDGSDPELRGLLTDQILHAREKRLVAGTDDFAARPAWRKEHELPTSHLINPEVNGVNIIKAASGGHNFYQFKSMRDVVVQTSANYVEGFGTETTASIHGLEETLIASNQSHDLAVIDLLHLMEERYKALENEEDGISPQEAEYLQYIFGQLSPREE